MNNTLNMFSIFDCKAKAYLQPFFSLNSDTATREFDAAVNGESTFSKFPEDYSLFRLGSFDQVTGQTELLATPDHVINAITLRKMTRLLETISEENEPRFAPNGAGAAAQEQER